MADHWLSRQIYSQAKAIYDKVNIGPWLGRLVNARSDPDIIIRDVTPDMYDPSNKPAMITCSLQEDQLNSHYNGILNTLANHCVGTIPIPVCLSEIDELNDNIEDLWLEWGVENEIGSAIRQARRIAATTGLAIIIPHRKPTAFDIKLGFQVLGQDCLKNPFKQFKGILDNSIRDGVEYWPTGDVKAVYINVEGQLEPARYKVPEEAFVWSRKRTHNLWPECASAFGVYPSIRRYIANAVRGEEMRSAIPMAVKLGISYKNPNNAAAPKGAFQYEPGMVMTLPPDTELQGLNWGHVAGDREKFIDIMVSTAARCIDMPRNLALASSSDSNMATAHIDLQPWKYVVDIDRFDFERFVRWTFRKWYGIAKYSPRMSVKAFDVDKPPILFNYTVLFDHPDPAKRASARSTDLISGASTLTRIYADQGLTARREIQKECKLLGITKKQYYKQLLASRSKQVAEVLYGSQEAVSDSTKDNPEQQRPNQSKVRRVQR